jgi:hypothetical protein
MLATLSRMLPQLCPDDFQVCSTSFARQQLRMLLPEDVQLSICCKLLLFQPALLCLAVASATAAAELARSMFCRCCIRQVIRTGWHSASALL